MPCLPLELVTPYFPPYSWFFLASSLFLFLSFLLLHFYFHFYLLNKDGNWSLFFISFLALGVTCLTISYYLRPPVIHNESRGARGGPKRSILSFWTSFPLHFSISAQWRVFPSRATFPFLPSCSLYALSPLPHWPSEPCVRPERGLCDLQLCLLSTQTSVRTAGRTREGQTVESMSAHSLSSTCGTCTCTHE